MEVEQLPSMTERYPNVLEVLIGQIRRTEKLTSFSAKRCAYCPRPSFSSQSATCCIGQRPGLPGFISPHRPDYPTNPQGSRRTRALAPAEDIR